MATIDIFSFFFLFYSSNDSRFREGKDLILNQKYRVMVTYCTGFGYLLYRGIVTFCTAYRYLLYRLA